MTAMELSSPERVPPAGRSGIDTGQKRRERSQHREGSRSKQTPLPQEAERCAAPTAHKTNATPSAAPSTSMRRSGLVSRLSTQASHSAVAYIGKARNCRKVDIHAPGFGRRRSHGGRISDRYKWGGEADP